MKPCLKCVKGNFFNSLFNKCIENSFFKSLAAMLEGFFNLFFKKYHNIDLFIFPSKFMLEKHMKIGLDNKKFLFLPNFSRFLTGTSNPKEISGTKSYLPKVKFDNYHLYFGRLSVEKGIHFIIKLAKKFPVQNFVFVGSGPMESSIPIKLENIQLLPFLGKDDLKKIILNAKSALSPSLWYENSPLNVIESLFLNVPVIGSNIGGIPEFIDHGNNGYLFKPGDFSDFASKFELLLNRETPFDFSTRKLNDVRSYSDRLEFIFQNLIDKKSINV
jgi:glycosyltransferase involved in cell wall biosynthesis